MTDTVLATLREMDAAAAGNVTDTVLATDLAIDAVDVAVALIVRAKIAFAVTVAVTVAVVAVTALPTRFTTVADAAGSVTDIVFATWRTNDAVAAGKLPVMILPTEFATDAVEVALAVNACGLTVAGGAVQGSGCC